MKKSEKQIISDLLKEHHLSIQKILTSYGLTNEKLEQLKNEVNERFHQDIIFSNDEIIYIPHKYSKRIASHYHIPIDEMTPIFKPEVRRDVAFLKIALDNSDYLSLLELSDHCLASKNTLTNDIKVVNNEIKDDGISIEYTRKNGFHLAGDEVRIRAEIINIVDRLFLYPNGRNLLEDKVINTKEEHFLLTERIRKLERKINITFSDEYLSKLPYIILIMIKRASVMKDEWTLPIKYQELNQTSEFKQIQELFWEYPDLSVQDLAYLSLIFLGANRIDLDSNLASEKEVEEFVLFIIERLEDKLAFNFGDNQFKKKLIQHLSPALIRKRLGLTLENPIQRDFINRYYPVYEVIKEIVDEYKRITLSEAEVVYLSMIVLGHMYQVSNDAYQNNKDVTAIVVCQSGNSISELMNVQLKDMFPNINFLGTYSERQFYYEAIDVDIVFTTAPLETDKKTFVMVNLFDEKKRKEFIKRVENHIVANPSIKTKQLMNFLRDVIPEEKFEDIKEKAHRFFQDDKESTDITDSILKINQINFVHTNNIFEMAQIGLNKMLERESITSAYSEEALNIFKEKYESMLIGPEVYLPHAHYNDGAYYEDFQLVISPIIKTCVLCLSPSKGNSHVKKLLQFNSLFMDAEFMDELYNSGQEDVFKLVERRYKDGIQELI
ncbi:BglG family transcription antiterminator [Oceanobacillus jeddahense]|uniref:PRD domain-containing protein n=1 Tax=Oceanobacillus jeddahense TaxID=1462527 RepID=A0ABY5JRR2_9BACI|nr:PRD domain-containing protein [Oceanobacillus jeddahense]UUI03013.1 PRD domain-containing protein [Oceanobacillus jeddahense]